MIKLLFILETTTQIQSDIEITVLHEKCISMVTIFNSLQMEHHIWMALSN